MFSSSSSSSKLFCIIWVFFSIGRSDAQAPAPAPATTTDPTEVEALNSTLNSWGISALTTQNPCNDDSVDSTDWKLDCNCDSADSFCHITELTVKGISASGAISEQLGNLQFLTSLDIGMNNFNGTLPSVLGNLTSLRTLRLNSLGPGINGEIPPSFANLKNLQSLWISDNSFTGKLPDFFGDLTALRDLRIQGNSFGGPIPTSFSNLINLTNLQIGELSTETEDIEFFANMTSLKNLILRNTRITGVIPNRTSWDNMEFLDLSFNNLIGTIPQSLLNLPKLKYLFLGNNSLTGSLPDQKIEELTAIDVSYNQLSGSIPSWVQNGTLNLNFIANNFNISTADVNNGNLSPQLECLQRNFSCNKGSPNQSSFAINCGSAVRVTQTDASYDVDNTTLGPAKYYVQDEKWAVSNVGKYIDGSNITYIQNIGSRFPNSQSSELFQAARISPSSLRYYGIGLENGAYNVELQFGETDNWDPNGLRLFDIYIQGILVKKDFNIFQEAGNKTLTAVPKNYTTNITDNFLDIHFFWAGKGTCCLPTSGTYGPSISAISVSKTERGEEESASPTSKASAGLIAGLTVVAFVLCSLFIGGGLFLWRKRRRGLSNSEDEELQEISRKLTSYSYSELKNATMEFNEDHRLGEGGFGPVYKGVLSDGNGTEIAVKKLSVASVQGKKQFMTEIATISTIQHRNLVKLHGCCCEGNKRLLVYEYMANRSLDKALFGNNTTLHLDWPARFKILLGTARGLTYLHEESAVRIVHRDVKASNILLDNNLDPKVSDFGLAKLRDDTKSHISTGVAGTVGYLAPEYAMRGQLTEKADVFGFGVVALEVIYGRRNTEPSLGMEEMYLLEWAWHIRKEKQELEMIDPKLLSSNYDRDEVSRVIGIAILCTQTSPTLRPTMSAVVGMLVGDLEVPVVLKKPSYLMDFRYTEGTSSASMTSRRNSSSVPPSYNHILKSTTTSALLEIGEGR